MLYLSLSLKSQMKEYFRLNGSSRIDEESITVQTMPLPSEHRFDLQTRDLQVWRLGKFKACLWCSLFLTSGQVTYLSSQQEKSWVKLRSTMSFVGPKRTHNICADWFARQWLHQRCCSAKVLVATQYTSPGLNGETVRQIIPPLTLKHALKNTGVNNIFA